MADEVHQVGGILAVVDGEGRIEADFAAHIRAAAARRSPWKVPDQGSAAGALVRAASARADDALDAPGHLGRRAPREGHQQDAARDRRR